MCVPDSSYKHDQNHSVLQMPLESLPGGLSLQLIQSSIIAK